MGSVTIETKQVLVITGPSGVGKGTLIKRLLDDCPDIKLAVSATTRNPRPGELEGTDYYFLTPEAFEQHIAEDDFIEYASYAGNYYGTFKSELENKDHQVLLEIDVEGSRQLLQSYPGALRIFIVPTSISTLEERLVKRGTDTPEQIKQRLERAQQELDATNEFDFLVVNDEIEASLEELVSVIRSF